MSRAAGASSEAPRGTTAVGGRPTEGGPGSSFDQTYLELRPAMDRLAYLLVRDRAASHDLVSDAFAILFERYDSVDNPGGYLRVVLVRLCNTSRARSIAEAERLDQLATLARPTLATPDHDDTWDALGRLTPGLRAVIVLRFYEDLSHSQIAEALDCPVATVRTRLHRALGALRTELRP